MSVSCSVVSTLCLNCCLQVEGRFSAVMVEAFAWAARWPGGGQRPRLLFEPVQQLGDALLLLVGQLNRGGEELLGSMSVSIA